MKEIIVERGGAKDLKFKGKVLASASSRRVAGKEQTRWTEITVYQTESGRYVVAREHITLWQGELNGYSAEICETPEEVVAELTSENAEGEYFSGLAKEILSDLTQESKEFEAFQYEEV